MTSVSEENWAKSAAEQEKNLFMNSKDKDIKLSSSATDGSGDTEEPEISAAEVSLMKKILRKRLVQSSHDVEVQQKDPNSPLYSVKSFEQLNINNDLLKGVYAMGFNFPSKIQGTALPALLADPPQNMIAQSQNGTGKTAAFILASLSRVDPSKPFPQVLILSPTYELATQTASVAKQMGQYCQDIKFCLAVKGERIPRGRKITEQVIIGTPGKVMDWSLRYKLFDVQNINVYVLDEADVMIAIQGHHDQCIRVHKKLSKECQMMLFSATYNQEVMDFAEIIVPNPVVIRLRKEEESLDNIKQFYVVCKNIDEKFSAISNIYGVISVGQAIIFCQTKKTASWLSEKLVKEGHAVALISGDMFVSQRIAVLNRFRDGKEKVLITTNVCARGIDVEQVSVVVNFDLPVDQKGKADCETYLHRIGRAGRFGKIGLAINIVDGPRTIMFLKQIEDHFGLKILRLDAEDVDELEKLNKN
ncbi:DEAD-box helicase Dbp80-like isoform X2 [Tachypleus tridentatus]|uniref:DEAD-box helicase Dbp80-like isoform X2 n=1 Tax=Tachypleus tridentatus TaxID=6853 RepID=UPI003FD2E578